MPDLIITPKGKSYQRQLNHMMAEGSVSDLQDDDWDVLYELEHGINRWGSATDSFLLGMPDRSQGLGSMDSWDDEEEHGRIKGTIRRLFEEGYIKYSNG